MAAAEEFVLKNGTTVVYEYIPNTQIASIHAWINVGSVSETPKLNGISHFLEHILFKGTKNYGPDEIDNVVESRGGLMNAGTSKDYTNYHITLPAEHAETAFKVISDMVFFASFITDEIEKEKPVVVQEIQRKYDNPTYDMWKEAMELLYAGTPYAMEIIGTEENVLSFTPENLKNYYRSHYHPENITLVAVGDLPLERVKEYAEKYFSHKPEVTANKGYKNVWKPTLKEPIFRSFEREVAQDYILVGWQVPAVAKDAPVYEVLSEVLSGGDFSLLNQELKYKKAVVVAVSSGEMLYKYAGAYMVHMVANPGEAELATAALKEALKQVMEDGVSEDELRKAKNRLISRTVFRQEKSSSEASEIGYSYTLELKDYYNTYKGKIEAIKAADVAFLAKQIFSSPAVTVKTVPLTKK